MANEEEEARGGCQASIVALLGHAVAMGTQVDAYLLGEKKRCGDAELPDWAASGAIAVTRAYVREHGESIAQQLCVLGTALEVLQIGPEDLASELDVVDLEEPSAIMDEETAALLVGLEKALDGEPIERVVVTARDLVEHLRGRPRVVAPG